MNKPLYQRIITTYFPWVLLSITFVGSLIDTLENLELIKPIITYAGTIIIFIGVIALEIRLQKKPVYWVAESGEKIRIKSLGVKNIIVSIGLIIALWIPRFLPDSSNPNPPSIPPVTIIPPAITVVVSNPNTTSIKEPNILFKDNFNEQNLKTEWQWIDPANDSKYDLDSRQKILRIDTSEQNHNLYGVDNYNAPRLMLSASQDNFAITTQVQIPPGTNYQGAGLLLWQDEDNYVRLEYAHGYNRTGPHIWYRTHGEPQAPGDERDDPEASYLKIIRTGTTVRTFFSNNDTDWKQIGEVVYIKSTLPIWVGLTLVNGTQGIKWSAEFKFFIMEES